MTRKQIHDLLDITLDVNGLEPRRREETGTKPTAFFQFSGHVANVTIDIYKKGWQPGAMHNIRVELGTNVPYDVQSDIDNLRAKADAILAHKEPDPQSIARLDMMIYRRNEAASAAKKAVKSDIRERFELVASTIKNLIDDTFGENAYITLSDGLITRSPDWLG